VNIAISELVARDNLFRKASIGSPVQKRWVEEDTFSALPYYGDEEDTFSALPYYPEDGKAYPIYYEEDRFVEGGEVEPWQLTLLIGATIIGILFIILMKYTVSLLITLTSVEEPAPVYLPAEAEDSPDTQTQKPSADEYPPKRYITSSIRGTLRHLRSEAGFFSAWRGFSAHAALTAATIILREVVIGLFDGGVPEPVARIIGSVVISVFLARLSMVCTHIMISKPQNVTWFTRLWATPWSLARRTIPALVFCNVASQLVAEFSLVTSRTSNDLWMMLAFIAVDIYLLVFIVLPATIALIRVQASFLPDDQESIVPFDRTFGKTDGQTGITFREAWRSVGRDGWKRIAKLIAKTYIPTFILSIAVGAIAAFTWSLIPGLWY